MPCSSRSGPCCSPSDSWSGSCVPSGAGPKPPSEPAATSTTSVAGSAFAFRRSVTYYVGALVLLSAVAAAVGHLRHATSVLLLLASVGTLGVSFFFALLLASSGRIELVLVCWAATFAVLAADLAVIRIVQGHADPDHRAHPARGRSHRLHHLVSVLSRPVLRSPLSY